MEKYGISFETDDYRVANCRKDPQALDISIQTPRRYLNLLHEGIETS